MNTRLKEIDLDRKQRVLNCLRSPVTLQVIDQDIKRFLNAIGYQGDNKFTVCEHIASNDYSLSCHVNIYDSACYDWLMHQKETYIGSAITYYKNKVIEFTTHSVTIEISYMIYCDLPGDDFKTLDMLGKVHRSYTEGHMSESIYCEV